MYRFFSKRSNFGNRFNAIGVMLLCFCSLSAQNNTKRSLLVVSCDVVKDCKQETLHKFTFMGGNFLSQEELATLPRKKAHFGLWTSQIFENRYIVSTSSEIFDIQEKTLYEKVVGRFAAYENGKVFIDEVGNLDIVREILKVGNLKTTPQPTKTYSFDLATKKYSSYQKPNFFSIFPDGSLSPRNDKLLYHFNDIHLVHRRGENGYLIEALKVSLRMTFRKKSGGIEEFPARTFWVDNDRFLTQRRNGELVIFDIRAKKWSSLERIAVPADIHAFPSFYSDDDGNIFYRADKAYRIDLEKGTHIETEEFGLGYGFKRVGVGDLKLFLVGDQKLGTFISGFSKTTEGYLAAEFQDEPLMKSGAIGIRVWGADSGKWTSIKIKHFPRIIGWISE